MSQRAGVQGSAPQVPAARRGIQRQITRQYSAQIDDAAVTHKHVGLSECAGQSQGAIGRHDRPAAAPDAVFTHGQGAASYVVLYGSLVDEIARIELVPYSS